MKTMEAAPSAGAVMSPETVRQYVGFLARLSMRPRVYMADARPLVTLSNRGWACRGKRYKGDLIYWHITDQGQRVLDRVRQALQEGSE